MKKADGSYVIDHSAGMYVYDKKRKKLGFTCNMAKKPAEMASDIKKVVCDSLKIY